MLKSDRQTDRICIAAVVLACILTAGVLRAEELGITAIISFTPAYAGRLFDDSRVHDS